jgi:hypothetical protein
LNGLITGVALSVAVEQLKWKISCVCDARHLVQRRPGGERDETEKTVCPFLKVLKLHLIKSGQNASVIP